MSTNETSTDSKPRWGALVKGAVGTAVVAIGGYLGAATMQVISAPKDSVAYDLIQSMTGMLKPEPARTASPSEPKPVPPAASEPKMAANAAADAGPSPVAPRPSSPAPAAAPSPQAAPGAEASQAPAPAGTMLDRVRQTAGLAERTRDATAALANTRVLSLADRARTPICGADYELEVASVAAGAGEVALRRVGDRSAPVRLAVGQQPKDLGAGCRIVLLSTMEDLTNRRAQLREIAAR